jgi:uncharacterized membrane protein SpoIIM required for sporulation
MSAAAEQEAARPPPVAHPWILGSAVSLGVYLLGVALGSVGALATSAGQISANPARISPWNIFGHNLGILAWTAGGLITGGLITVGILGLNGMLLGWIAAKQFASGHGRLVTTGILPHLPLELSAYVISAGATLVVSTQLIRRVFGRNRGSTPPDWRRWLTMQLISVILIFFAAIVEASLVHA